MCTKIYALKPFEADVSCVSPPAESSTLFTLATADGRGTSGDVIVAPGSTSANSDATV